MSLKDNISETKEEFPRLNDEEKIKVFSQLAQIRGTEGATAIMDLLRLYANTGTLPESIIWSLGTFPEHADIYFPELLNYATIPKFGDRIYALCVLYISCKWLPPDKLAFHFVAMMSHYRSIKDQLKKSDNHYENYMPIYYLLEIFGYFPKPEVEAELYEALDRYTEVGLKYRAIYSLWRLGKRVDDKYIVELIADDSIRGSIYWHLQERGELHLFPEQYRTAESFARARLVSYFETMDYSIYELEFTGILPIESSNADNSGDYYIYRVLTDFVQGDDKYWVTGWAGPVPSDFDYVNVKNPQKLFSRTGFSDDHWDSISARRLVTEHLNRYHKGKSH
ncbi:MAG: hypothetical protein LCI00_16425 [Chloroflexi bacterium]|nr:hypothetical protein [Chloroflexota bacterium]MCC6892819.1 hypothetical protein [Anaerolineae bacterium]